MYYLKYIPPIIQGLYPSYLWRIPNAKETVYLSFDDGPHPEITPWVLDELSRYQAKATFFTVGANVDRYPEVAQQIVRKGHLIGNHTYHHVNGALTSNSTYFEEIRKGGEALQRIGIHTSLFRPPYGRMKYAQLGVVKKSHQIIMMDVVAGDFDPRLDGNQVAQNVLKNYKAGSIILLHDSKKASDRLKVALPVILKSLYERGISMQALPI